VLELVITSLLPDQSIMAEVAAEDQDIVMPVKHLGQRAAVHLAKDIPADTVPTIMEHQKAHTTAVAEVVAQEHKDIIVPGDMDKLAAVKDKPAASAALWYGEAQVAQVAHIAFQFHTVQLVLAEKAAAAQAVPATALVSAA
jgi:hypothetical protein